MSAYYNEIDAHAAAWLRALIHKGLIADGEVDERSITEVDPDDLRGFDQCHFFAGIGGWSYALRLAGVPDDRPVWTGSCPCQPFSAAGKQRGSDDERHLWPAFFRLIRECRPAVVVGEQVAGAAGYAWFDHVAADLEGEAYAAAACDLGAHSVGAPHIRQRLYWAAHSDQQSQPVSGRRDVLAQGKSKNEQPVSGLDGSRIAFHRSDADRCCEVCGMADNRSGGCERGQDSSEPNAQGTRQRSEGVPNLECLCNAGLLGDAKSTRSQGQRRQHCTSLGSEHRRFAGLSGNAWSDIEWIACIDGKSRPTQRGIFPLAYGLPEGLVRGGDRSLARDADSSAEARVMRLRGYGNAIVPQVAAAFIRRAFA